MACKRKCVLINQIFDPGSEFIINWNRFIFVVGVINFYVDPMFLYIATLDESTSSLKIDLPLGIALAAIRTLGDCFLLLGILVKFCTAYEAPGSRVFTRRNLIEEPKDIAVKYLKSSFTLDLVAALPLPEVYIWKQILASKTPLRSSDESEFIYMNLFMMWWIQVFPRINGVTYSKKEITETAGVLMQSGMSGAFYNLFWFMNFSNNLGAIYYFAHMNWVSWCRNIVQKEWPGQKDLGWNKSISICSQSNEIETGIYSSAFQNKIGTRSFFQRYMFCFSWGLKSISSLGQNFTTSYSTSETSLSIVVTLLGLIFFADLVTRMQVLSRDAVYAFALTYTVMSSSSSMLAGIQSMEEREEQQRARQREVKEWMNYHQLPLDLKERVDLAIQSEWTENGIDDEFVLDSLPLDLRSEIRKYLYMDSICKLPKFADMDTPLVEAICQYLKTFSGKESSYVVYEGDVVKKMLFIFRGQLELSFTDRVNTSLTILGPGECCGQELVTWASQPTTSIDNLPSSTWTIKCLTDVEAFMLQAYDMKILATQFAHNQDFQHAFKQHYP